MKGQRGDKVTGGIRKETELHDSCLPSLLSPWLWAEEEEGGARAEGVGYVCMVPVAGSLHIGWFTQHHQGDHQDIIRTIIRTSSGHHWDIIRTIAAPSASQAPSPFLPGTISSVLRPHSPCTCFCFNPLHASFTDKSDCGYSAHLWDVIIQPQSPVTCLLRST